MSEVYHDVEANHSSFEETANFHVARSQSAERGYHELVQSDQLVPLIRPRTIS